MIRIEISGVKTQGLVKLNSVFKVQREKDGGLCVYVWCYDPKARDIRLKKAGRGDTLLIENYNSNFAYGIEHGDAPKQDEPTEEQSGMSLDSAVTTLEAIQAHVYGSVPLKVNNCDVVNIYYDDMDDVVRMDLKFE